MSLPNDAVVMSELTGRQKTVLQDAAGRVNMARRQAEEVYKEYQRLIAMAMPEGATGFDLESGIFYYAPPPKPEIVDEDAEDEASDN